MTADLPDREESEQWPWKGYRVDLWVPGHEPQLEPPLAWPPEYRALALSPLSAGLDPWELFAGNHFTWALGVVREGFSRHRLLPFAKDQRCDDMVCFDLRRPPRIALVDWPDGTQRIERHYENLDAWLRSVLIDILDYYSDERQYLDDHPGAEL